MQLIQVVPNPNPGQVDSLGFKLVQLVDYGSASSGGIQPGDPVMLVCLGGAPNQGEIGILWPWQQLTDPIQYIGGTDAAGNITYPASGLVMAPSAGGPWPGNGLLVAKGILPPYQPGAPNGGTNLFGPGACLYGLPGPVVPVLPSFATFLAAVLNSFNSHVPVVDFLAPASWAAGNYVTQTPFSPTPVTVPFGAPIALSDAATAAIVAQLGGTATKLPPLATDYVAFYTDPGALPGSLSSVNYITAEVPIGENGALVLARALAGSIASAMFYGRQTGLQAMLLNCFLPVTPVTVQA